MVTQTKGATAATREPGLPSPSEPGQDVLVGHVWSREGGLRRFESTEGLIAAFADASARVWVDVENASEALLQALAGCLDLHELVVEDIIERNQRAKVEYTAELMHIVMFALTYQAELLPAEIDIVLGPRFLLTSHSREWRPLETHTVERSGVEAYLSKGCDFALYAVVDPIVDAYFPVIDQLSEDIDELEDDVVRRPDGLVVERLFRVRRALLEVRHMVAPEREIFNQLTNRENPLIDAERIIYFRDVYDHLIRITDELDTHRELIAGALDAYLSTVNNNLSSVMKRLTAVTAILAGVGAVAGIFGMSEATLAFNFQQGEGPGFWLVTGLVFLVGAGAFAYFRRIGWI
jgi:magnesium transporter